MAPRKVLHPDKPGRPPKAKKDRENDARRRKGDSARLQRILADLELSQADVERLTGIRQGWVNDLVKARRDLSREDLRRLGKIGISADYLLGNTEENIPPGQSRGRAHLEADLAVAVERELTKLHPPVVQGSKETHEWRVSGSAALEAAVAALGAEAKEQLARVSEVTQLYADFDAILAAADRLSEEVRGEGGITVEDTKAARDLLNVTRRASKRLHTLELREDAGVVLVDSEIIENVARAKEQSAKGER